MCKVCATKELFAHRKELDDRKQEENSWDPKDLGIKKKKNQKKSTDFEVALPNIFVGFCSPVDIFS